MNTGAPAKTFGGIKRWIAAVMFCCALVSVSATAAEANPAPGCSPLMFNLQINFAELQRLKDFALSTILRQADTALGLTCFDQALALSSRLGAVFSDLSPAKITAVMQSYVEGQSLDSLYNTAASMLMKNGHSNTLADGYKNTISFTLTNYMGGAVEGLNATRAFAYSIVSDMGGTVTGALESLVSDIMNFFNGANSIGKNIINDASTVEGYIGKLFELIEIMEAVMCILGVTSDPIEATVYSIVGALLSVMSILTEVIMIVQDVLAVTGIIQGELLSLQANTNSILSRAKTSLSGQPYGSGPLKIQVGLPTLNSLVPSGCKQMIAFWKGAIDGNGVIIPGLLGAGVPFPPHVPGFTARDLISVKLNGTNITPGDPNAKGPGSVMESILQTGPGGPGASGTNNSLLTSAMNDAVNLLGAPGALPFWPKWNKQPGANSSVNDVVTEMKSQ